MSRALAALVALAALTLGVQSAAASASLTTTVTVEVIGKGTVTSSPGGIKCGNGKKTCYLTFSGDVTLTGKAASGWTFDGWDDPVMPPFINDCDGNGTGTCDLADGGDYIAFAYFSTSSTTTSTLSVAPGAGGDVSGPEHDPPGSEIECGSGGSLCTWGPVLTGSTLTVFQTPDVGNLFTGWGGDCGGTGQSCTVQLSGNKAVSATWSANAPTTLTVSVDGDGNVSGGGIDCPSACVASEPLNSTVTLTAQPGSGQVFSAWTGGCTGASPTCNVTMSDDQTVTATFVAANTLTVHAVGSGSVSGGSGAINCGNGADACSANFAQNATVSLVAVAATGAVFSGWSGACGGTATTCTVFMSQSKDVTATFTAGTGGGTTGFTLTVSVVGNGTVTGGGINCGNGATLCSSPNHAANSTLTLVATPSAGATFTGWSGGTCAGTATTCTVAFTSNKTVTATFAGGTANFPLTVAVTGPGRVSGSGINCGNGASTCTASVAAGTAVVLSAVAVSGARFGGWGGACTGTVTTCRVTMSAARTVSATFTGGGTAGTLTIKVGGRGRVSTTLGACVAVGPSKSCVQHFKAGSAAVLTTKPAAGQSFLGWSGACAGKKATCTVSLATAQSVTANFTNRTPRQATLKAIGKPIVKRSSTGYRVTLRFSTTRAGTAHVRGLRAGRTGASVSLRVGSGRATLGPFPVAKPGLYTFEIRLGGSLLRMKACLGRCGAAHKGDPFVLAREAPAVTRTGDVWSVTLHARASQISDARVRALRGGKLLVNRHFLGRATRFVIGPFLLGPGNYTLKLTATDPYGRTRTLTWIVSLA